MILWVSRTAWKEKKNLMNNKRTQSYEEWFILLNVSLENQTFLQSNKTQKSKCKAILNSYTLLIIISP